MSDDRPMRFLQYLAILLFLSAGVLPLARGRRRWAKWGAIAVFSVAFAYAVVLVVRWVLALA